MTLSQNKTKRFHQTQSLSLLSISIWEPPQGLCTCGLYLDMCLLLTHRCKPWAHPLGHSSDMPGPSHMCSQSSTDTTKSTGLAAGQPHCQGYDPHCTFDGKLTGHCIPNGTEWAAQWLMGKYLMREYMKAARVPGPQLRGCLNTGAQSLTTMALSDLGPRSSQESELQ